MFSSRRILCTMLLSVASAAFGDAEAQPGGPAHRTVRPGEIAWQGGGSGVSSAVLEGDPAAEGVAFTLALKLADGAWIAPHFHPNPKRVVVLSGTLLMGMGDSVVAASAEVLPGGSFSLVPANAHHYEGAQGETVILLIGIGPLRTTFVDARGNPIRR
jgi:quercetin dioxygenase-like cupin family protein